MPLAPIVIASIIGGGASIAGGALANRGKSTESTAPTWDPSFSPLKDQLLQMVKTRLGTSPDLSGYTGTGISDINRSYDVSRQNTENSLTARGLAGSPVAANADLTRDLARVGDVARFRNSIPLLSRQLQTQDLGLAGNLLNMGRGVTSTGTTEGGGGAAGAFTNLASYLGYLQGSGAFSGKAPLGSQQTVSPLGLLPTGSPGLGGY